MKENLLLNKSFNFALEIIEIYKYLTIEKKEYVLSKQLLKSGTSIGANIEEAIGSQSKKDFLAKVSIAYKEARETHYWLSNYLSLDESSRTLEECTSLIKIITKIQKTLKEQVFLNSN